MNVILRLITAGDDESLSDDEDDFMMDLSEPSDVVLVTSGPVRRRSIVVSVTNT